MLGGKLTSVQQRDLLWTKLHQQFGVSPSFEKIRLLIDHYEVVGSSRLSKENWDFAVLTYVFSAIPHMHSLWPCSSSCWDEIRNDTRGLSLLVKEEAEQPQGLEYMIKLYGMVKVHVHRCEEMMGEGNAAAFSA